MIILCLVVVFIGSPELVRKGVGALPMVGFLKVQGGTGFKGATTTMNMENFIPSLYDFPTKFHPIERFYLSFLGPSS